MSSRAVSMQVRVHKDTDGVSKERRKRDQKFWESPSNPSHRLRRPRSCPPTVARIPGDNRAVAGGQSRAEKDRRTLEVLYITEARDVQDETVWGKKV